MQPKSQSKVLYKIGIYLRVSTEEQALVIEGSLDSQKYRLQNFVEIKNMQESNWGKVVEIYSDEGISAKDTRRPSFQRMIKDVRNGKINLILVTDLSRLSRSFCRSKSSSIQVRLLAR
jgi:site-specific DNA recombinase